MNQLHLVIFSIAFVCVFTDEQPIIVGGRQSNPGVEIVLTKKALDYIYLTAGDFTNDVIKTVVVKDLKFEHSLSEVEIKDVRITRFESARFFYQLMPQDCVLWGFRNLAFTFNSEVHLSFIDWEGHSELSAGEINLNITARLSVTSSGQPILAEVGCETKAHGLEFERIKCGLIGKILDSKGIKSRINDFMRRHFENAICNKAIDFVGIDMNVKLRTLRIKRTLTSDLQLDMSFLFPPIAENQRLRENMKGEFGHWLSTRPTPFFPHILDTSVDENRTINVFISDYTLNSFFFIAFELGALGVVLHNKEYLKTNSENGTCLTDYFPLVVRAYPDHSASLHITWIEPIVARVTREKITVYATGLFRLLMAKPGQKSVEAVSAKFKAVFDVRFSIVVNDLVDGGEIESIRVQQYSWNDSCTNKQLCKRHENLSKRCLKH